MINLDTTSIESNLATKVAGLSTSSTVQDFFAVADAVAASGLDTAFYVNTSTDLPDLYIYNIPDGQLVYVKAINLHVIAWKKKWMSLDGRTYRDDSNVNSIWSWGYGATGRLGDNTSVNKSSPVSVVGGITDWCQVSTNGNSNGIRYNGTIWAWGCNYNGQLGDNTTVSKSSPVQVVGGFTDWCQISAGSIHSSAVRANGTLWTWGFNNDGRLGDNTIVNKSSPVSVVGGFTDWCQVSAGSAITAAVRTNGTIWTWGANCCGRLGDNTTVNKSSPVSVVGGFTDWLQVSAGAFHVAGIRSNGTLWTWGWNSSGQLGDNTIVNKSSPVSVVGGAINWCQVSAGAFHVAGIRSNGTLWTWGYNGTGQLGDNTIVAKSSPVSVVGGFTNWCQVSACNSHSAAVRTNGTIWTWGCNNYGQLGDNTIANKSSPVSVGGGFSDWCQVSAGSLISSAIRST